ncbi:DUF2798 domain-containing protein [Rhodovulum sp. DZ06]|uniref:DUF2798 domain-containing protein n=1 Tax=Rhodovulum sp. DZ06 TaxID=3425126 RepID=UPI003D34AECA
MPTDTRARLIAGFLMSGTMSLTMSGIMAVIFMPGVPTLGMWLSHWLMAWPFAFVLSAIYAPIMGGIAMRLAARRT